VYYFLNAIKTKSNIFKLITDAQRVLTKLDHTRLNNIQSGDTKVNYTPKIRYILL
jgi:hypothetical protein